MPTSPSIWPSESEPDELAAQITKLVREKIGGGKS
jgi:hypothetical protein